MLKLNVFKKKEIPAQQTKSVFTEGSVEWRIEKAIRESEETTKRLREQNARMIASVNSMLYGTTKK